MAEMLEKNIKRKQFDAKMQAKKKKIEEAKKAIQKTNLKKTANLNKTLKKKQRFVRQSRKGHVYQSIRQFREQVKEGKERMLEENKIGPVKRVDKAFKERVMEENRIKEEKRQKEEEEIQAYLNKYNQKTNQALQDREAYLNEQIARLENHDAKTAVIKQEATRQAGSYIDNVSNQLIKKLKGHEERLQKIKGQQIKSIKEGQKKLKETMKDQRYKHKRNRIEAKQKQREKREEYESTGERIKTHLMKINEEKQRNFEKKEELWQDNLLRALEIKESNVG